MPRFATSQINDQLPRKYSMICFASFEDRCRTIIEKVDKTRLTDLYILRNVDQGESEANNKNYQTIEKAFERNHTVEVSITNPVKLSKGILCIIDKLIKTNQKHIVVDVTTFTHEALQIFIKGLYQTYNAFDSVLLVYNPSEKYADWLSKGCKEIRNVMGYPGFNNPTQNDHMIILTGFEKERATQLVEEFEPDFLSIGSGIEPTNINHQATMDSMKDGFHAWFNNLSIEWDSFEFSCSDIEKTVRILRDLVREKHQLGRNVQLVPLNTKLSTIASAIVAIKEPWVQLVYPIPETYNRSYAIPSNEVEITDLKNVFAGI